MTSVEPKAAGGGVIGELKRRLGPAYSVFHECSLQFQRGQVDADEYCDLALDILEANGSSELFLRLVEKLPNAAKRDGVLEAYRRRQEQQDAAHAAELQMAELQQVEEATAALGGSSQSSDGDEDEEEDEVLLAQMREFGFERGPGGRMNWGLPSSSGGLAGATNSGSSGDDGTASQSNAKGGDKVQQAKQQQQQHKKLLGAVPQNTPWVGAAASKYGYKAASANGTGTGRSPQKTSGGVRVSAATAGPQSQSQVPQQPACDDLAPFPWPYPGAPPTSASVSSSASSSSSAAANRHSQHRAQHQSHYGGGGASVTALGAALRGQSTAMTAASAALGATPPDFSGPAAPSSSSAASSSYSSFAAIARAQKGARGSKSGSSASLQELGGGFESAFGCDPSPSQFPALGDTGAGAGGVGGQKGGGGKGKPGTGANGAPPNWVPAYGVDGGGDDATCSTASRPPPNASISGGVGDGAAGSASDQWGGAPQGQAQAAAAQDACPADAAAPPCPVCLDAPPGVRLTPCGHELCRGCLELWRRQTVAKAAAGTSCPFCRGPITSTNKINTRSRQHPSPQKQMHAGIGAGTGVPPPAAAALPAPSPSAAAAGAGASAAAWTTAQAVGAISTTSTPSTSSGSRGVSVSGGGGCSSGVADAPVIVWLRRDLRVADNPALDHAASLGRPVVVVFIWAPQEYGKWPPGAAARVWIHHSLQSLGRTLQERYSQELLLMDGRGSSSLQCLRALMATTGARTVLYNRMYEPWCLERDRAVESALSGSGAAVRHFNGSLLYEPWDAAPDTTTEACWNSGYGSVRFFTSACQPLGPPTAPLEAPARLRPLRPELRTAAARQGTVLQGLGLVELPRRRRTACIEAGEEWRAGTPVDWAAGIRAEWRFGEAGAAEALAEFVENGLEHFDKASNAASLQSYRMDHGDDNAFPSSDAASSSSSGASNGRRRPSKPNAPAERFRADKRYTARISPYMAWGELSPRQVWAAVLARHGRKAASTFLRRLAWRDLAYWGLWRFPHMADLSLRPQYEAQRWAVYWAGDEELKALAVTKQRWDPSSPLLRAWQRGETGYPLVDASMRELWVTGYIPNYMRHVVAGFLIEYLEIDWRHGELWFHDTLCDADVAIQGMMWQNGGHSGFDQWNFVMHPVFAAKAADPEGAYVRRWCPELARLPLEFIHCPWEAPTTTLAAARVQLGRNYPRRIIADLDGARRSSLAAVVDMRRGPGRKYVLPDGHEALPLPDGRFARAITRIDYREHAEEPLTKQAAADLWDKRFRPGRDMLSTVMREQQQQLGGDRGRTGRVG